jgi:hypothetical protein
VQIRGGLIICAQLLPLTSILFAYPNYCVRARFSFDASFPLMIGNAASEQMGAAISD